jgi:hypothetical protein
MEGILRWSYGVMCKAKHKDTDEIFKIQKIEIDMNLLNEYVEIF